MFSQDITLNATAFTGVSAPKVAAQTSMGPGSQSVRAVPEFANTTPLELSIAHSEVKKGKAKYVRSTMALRRSNIPPTAANPEGVTSYECTARIIIERPVTSGILTNAEVVTQYAELLSVCGTSLSVSGTPTTNMLKFISREP